ncbi:MAG: di-trans,poly-cis-decaprenylcistransferase [Chloroflexaceae bacterium]|nr:di-trans,poly-cis-decaprenylcistransferase [Chloroflexaceae bacterium]
MLRYDQQTNHEASGEPQKRAGGGEPVPRHIALLMDGNRRWGRSRGLTDSDGHRAGAENILGVVRACLDLGVECLTLHSFSTENWRRSPEEVCGMLSLIGEFLDRDLLTIHAWGVRLLHLGRLAELPAALIRRMERALSLTRSNQRMTLAVAVNYGSRADMVDAVRLIVSRGIPPELIDEQTMAVHLSTAELPTPDLIIRTSGEQRLSNFLLWESPGCRFVSFPLFWPDFTPEHLRDIVRGAGAGIIQGSKPIEAEYRKRDEPDAAWRNQREYPHCR